MAKKKNKTKTAERDETIREFIKEAEDRCIPNIRAVVLFGSAARNEENDNSDIDLMVIVDDTKSKSPTFMKQVEKDFNDISSNFEKISTEVISLVEFWNGVRIGSPVIVNMVRDGVPVFDKDMFNPIKRLLEMGEIKPSIEMMERYRERVPKRIERIKYNKMRMVFDDGFYAFVESASVPIILSGTMPPKPEDIPNVLRSIMRKLKIKGINIKPMVEILKLRKDVKYKKLEDVTGIEVDIWLSKAEDFIKEMNDLSRKIENIKLDAPLSM